MNRLGLITETLGRWAPSTVPFAQVRDSGRRIPAVRGRDGRGRRAGQPITGDTLLVVLNAGAKPVPFVLPDAHPGNAWERLIDTAGAPPPATPPRLTIAARRPLENQSLQLLPAYRRD